MSNAESASWGEGKGQLAYLLCFESNYLKVQ